MSTVSLDGNPPKMPGSASRSEFAVRCGCGEILAQVDEQRAREAVAGYNERQIAVAHGPATLVQRIVLTTDWGPVDEPTSP